jgi:hypothetical protein
MDSTRCIAANCLLPALNGRLYCGYHIGKRSGRAVAKKAAKKAPGKKAPARKVPATKLVTKKAPARNVFGKKAATKKVR